MRLLFLLLGESWLGGVLSATLGAVGGVVSLLLITLIHAALSAPPAESGRIAGIFALLCGVVLVTQIGSKCLLVRLSQSTAARLRIKLCERILDAPLVELEAVGKHRLLATLIDDVNGIAWALTGLPSVGAQAMVLVAGIVYLATLSAPLAMCTVLVASLGVLSYLAGNRIANRFLRQAREGQDEVLRQLRDMIRGIKELKGHHHRQVEFMNRVFVPAEQAMRRHAIAGQSLQGVAQSWGRLMVFVGIGLLVFVWPRLQTVDAATLTGYTLTILYLTFPLENIVAWLPSANHASISLRKIDSLGLMIDSSEPPPRIRPAAQFASIELRNVTYRYGPPAVNGFSVGPLDLTLVAGEVLFIAGGNGSGKTTLAKLLTGLYAPSQGVVVLDGTEVNDLRRVDYRQFFSTVFVEGNLFDRLLGVQAKPDEIEQWCRLLGITEKVDVATGRLVTDELSRGQHKRLALLVACLDDRPVFVFDEWAAEQDPGFKDVFYRTILPELQRRGRTVVAITHDDRYFWAADRVLTLRDGRLDPSADETSIRGAA